MDYRDQILIVDDDKTDYKDMVKELNQHHYECYPKLDEFDQFKDTYTQFLFGVNRVDRDSSEDWLNTYLSKIEPRAIILDIDLRGAKSSDDTSGINFMRLLRRHFRWIPILILTRYSPIEIEQAFETGTRVFHLEKLRRVEDSASGIPDIEVGQPGGLYAPFIRNVVNPILRMLIEWDKNADLDAVLKELFSEYSADIIREFDRRFGIVEEHLDLILSNDQHLTNYAQISISALKYLVLQDSHRAAAVIDNLIEAKGLEEILSISAVVRQELLSTRDELIDALKTDDPARNLLDIIRRALKTALKCDDNDSILKEAMKLIMKNIAKHTKIINIFYATGRDLIH